MTRKDLCQKYRRVPYLVQRLKEPHDVSFGGKRIDEVFGFGGGGSGLSKEAWALLKPCFEFDYMGAAEFEFGALPKSLSKLVADIKNGTKLDAFSFVIQAKDIKDNWHRIGAALRKEKLPTKKDGTIYVICRADDRAFVEDVILCDATGELGVKEGTHLCLALDPISEYDSRTCGWYALDGEFFYFTSKPMWERTCVLFGLDDSGEHNVEGV